MVWTQPPTGKRGRRQQLSDAAIQACLTQKVMFGMPLRQTTGFVESLLQLVESGWGVPDFGTLCRCQKTLNVNLPYRGGTDPLSLLIDSTGIKAGGEGEWNARRHGGPKRRILRKILIGIDEETLEVRAVEVATSDLPPIGPSLITRVCRFDFDSWGFRIGQARRARSPQIAQAPAALALASGFRAMSVA